MTVVFEVCKGASTCIYKFGIITVIEMMMIMMTIILKIIYVLCISCSFLCLNSI